MNLQQIYDQLMQVLTQAGFTEIEIDLKPKNNPAPHVKIFVSMETPQGATEAK